jgi:ppGpp synthetase/RelA/SpoT-type nucleotidyltranferase
VVARTIEDQLREQYFALLPELTRVAEDLKTKIQYSILPISRLLKPHENLAVKARVKACDSAINKLKEQTNPSDPSKKRNPGAVFDRDHPEKYNLLSLRDLVGVRVLAFPSGIANEVDKLLRPDFMDWERELIEDNGEDLAFKYNGHYAESIEGLHCEYQVVSTLIGLFWDVEHAAIYKQSPNLRGLEPIMREHTSAVYRALKAFEDEFEDQILKSEPLSSIE